MSSFLPEEEHRASHEDHSHSIGRRLFGQPKLWRDWEDDEHGHGAEAQYWELFSDLLLVAAASAVADIFEEEQNLSGFCEFAVLYLIIINGWLLYTHHYTARFEETSLSHSIVLFFYLLGMAGSIVNAGHAQRFAGAVILQRIAFLCLLLPVGFSIPRTWDFVKVLAIIQGIALVCLGITALYPDESVGERYLLPFLACFETLTEIFMIYLLPGRKLVPIDIEHTKERLGVLVLVMTGETVITSTITYRENHQHTAEKSYYSVLGLSFLLIFMFTLLFFNVQPPPKDHAFRRSRLAGTSLMVLNKFVGMALLCIGAYIKLSVEAVSSGGGEGEEEEEEEINEFTSELIGLSVGAALTLLLGMRLCHYGGKIPNAEQPVTIQRFFWLWWFVMAAFCIIPFLIYKKTVDPVSSLLVYSGLVLTLCVVESTFTHTLEAYLPNEESAPLHGSQRLSTYHATATTAG